MLVPQVGGRVMGLRWHGHELFFTQPEREGTQEPPVADVARRKSELGFPLWGGEKTWLAPQESWRGGTPFYDLDSAGYALDRLDEHTVRMTSRVCRETGVRLERDVRLGAEPGRWSVTHRLVNASPRPVEFGLWSVAMLLRPGWVYLPRRPDSAFAGGVKNFDAEGELCTPDRCALEQLGDVALVRCENPRAFKGGVDSDAGWMVGIVEPEPGRLVGYRKSVATDASRPYPHGCVCEVYNSDRYEYFEMEILGPVSVVEPGHRAELREDQQVFDVSERPGPGVRVPASFRTGG